MTEIAAIGNREFVLGFGLAGVKGIVASKPEEEFQEMLENPDYGIIIIEEKMLGSFSSRTRAQAENSVRPVVMALSEEGSQQDLRRMVIKSIGVDLWG